MLDVGVLVGGVGRRRLLEVEGSALAVVRQVQRRQARAEGVRAVVEARDPAAQVEVVHWEEQSGLDQESASMGSFSISLNY